MSRILVLGGTGMTGRAVIRYLGAELPGADLAYSARRPSKQIGLPFVPFDTRARRAENVRRLADFDWAIICVGPFEEIGAQIHELCVEARTNCVDVNDSIDARRQIVALDRSCARAGVAVLTGCGLSPGLSSVILASAANRDPDRSVRSADAILFIGGKQEPGPASLRSMFATLGAPWRVLSQGREVTLPPALERSPAGTDLGYLVGYESPDIDRVRDLFPRLDDYRYRVCFGQLDADAAERLQRARFLRNRWLAERLARLAGRVGARRVRRRGVSPDNAVLTVALNSGDRPATQLVATGDSSYGITGAVAAIICSAVLRGQAPARPGVTEILDLAPAHPYLLARLARHGICATEAGGGE
ncbi:MAG: hypothetical protein LBD70_00555 [Bifidobacteriaceae bacterium]|jgi:hypothetical protein|nr:hypothetical protein [Bifidobacteriaceae bacterium]